MKSPLFVFPPAAILIAAGSFLSLLLLIETGRAQEPLSPLPGTGELKMEGDIASQLVDGVDRFLLKEIETSAARRAALGNRDLTDPKSHLEKLESDRKRLAQILGMRDPRIPIKGLEYMARTDQGSMVGETEAYQIHEVRWPSLGRMHGEGLFITPKGGEASEYVIAIPDADQTPEQICGLVPGVDPESQFARRLAEQGFGVIVPTLISRERSGFDWHGRKHGLTNREFLYRSAYELGRHPIGYEVQKVLSLLDWIHDHYRDHEAIPPIGVFGYGEGGMLALYAAALDSRIQVPVISGYVGTRNEIWKQPLDRNVFGLLEQFGDAELAAMIAPRRVIIEASAHPKFALPPGSAGGAPATIETPEIGAVQKEANRAVDSIKGLPEKTPWMDLVIAGAAPCQEQTLTAFLSALNPDLKLKPDGKPAKYLRGKYDPRPRLERQMREMDDHTQKILRESARVRQQFMGKLDTKSVEAYEKSVEHYRNIFRHDVIGHFDHELLAPQARTRKLKDAPAVDGVTFYEVVLDVFPDVIAYGVLCLPDGIKKDERRPVVVCQHGLEGRPQSTIGKKDFHYYKAFATELARRGFVTFAPQNLYIFQDRFRSLQRKAYPLKKTLFSIIVPQHQQIVRWLQTQAFVDPDRVGFYGLSYGGKSAMRIPPLVDGYCLSICSADFNEWVDKNASTRNPRSYVWTGEYEIFEWDLGSTFNYSEMAALIAPRPFMVERGHGDGVADDWTVAWEYAKVRHLYQARLKIGERTEIEWFDGPHSINGKGTYEFLHKHLKWPLPEGK